MEALKNKPGTRRVITGNAAAAYAARLCRPDVVSLYPITPQSEVIETLEKFHAEGSLDCEMVQVEGENSAQNVVCGASMAGGRVFTATSSYGLVFMYDAMFQTAGYRAPVVMINVNREPPGIHAVCSGQQDMISTRDTGWIQVIAETGQEILDLTIMAYRLAEDHDIQLPVMVNYDGYYLSYLAESVEIPEQDDVDHYLGTLKQQPPRPTLEPGGSTGCGAHGLGAGFVELRRKHMAALERARGKFDEVDAAYGAAFGRSYGGQIEEYRTADADIILVTSHGKDSIEEHFDADRDLVLLLESRGKKQEAEIVRQLGKLANVISVRQKAPLGLGHAVGCARDLVGDEPFAVLLPDDVIDAPTPCTGQLLEAYIIEPS